MNDELEFRQATADWLAAGSDRTPPHVFDAVALAVRSTRQERALWRPRMTISNPLLTRLGVAAVAILAVGLGWYALGPSRSGVGIDPTPTPTPTPTVVPSALATPTPDQTPITNSVGITALEPGTYRLNAMRATTDESPGTILVTLSGPGWTSWDDYAVDKNYDTSVTGAGPSIVHWKITNVVKDPCTFHALEDPAPGPSVDDLIAALTTQPGLPAAEPQDVVVDGYEGKSVELTVPDDLSPCRGMFMTFSDGQNHRWAQGPGEVVRVYVLGVEGVRRTFFARIPARTTPADRAELEDVISSIEIEPPSTP